METIYIYIYTISVRHTYLLSKPAKLKLNIAFENNIIELHFFSFKNWLKKKVYKTILNKSGILNKELLSAVKF